MLSVVSYLYFCRLGPMDIEAKVRQAPVARTKRTRPTESTRPEEVCNYLQSF